MSGGQAAAGRDEEMSGRDRSSMLWPRSRCVPSRVVRLRAVTRHNFGEH